MIVEDEQEGEFRAEYGKNLLKELSIRLNEKYGKGFSESNIKNMRQFFIVYSEKIIPIRQTVSSEFKNSPDKISEA